MLDWATIVKRKTSVLSMFLAMSLEEGPRKVMVTWPASTAEYEQSPEEEVQLSPS